MTKARPVSKFTEDDVEVDIAVILPPKRTYKVECTVHFDDLEHYCGVCGRKLQLVRPGKYQCNHCEEVEMLRQNEQ